MNQNNSNYIYCLVSQNIKKQRKLKGLTQQELADKIGYSVGFISNIESQKYLQTFSLDTLYLIAQKLDVDIKELFNKPETKK